MYNTETFIKPGHSATAFCVLRNEKKMRVETKKVFITKESDHEGAEEIAFFSEENCRRS